MDQQKTDFLTLSDEALAAAAWQQRREALHGNRFAFGRAHELERELRRRGSWASTLARHWLRLRPLLARDPGGDSGSSQPPCPTAAHAKGALPRFPRAWR